MRALMAKPAAAVSWANGPLQRKCASCGKSHAKQECPSCKQREAGESKGPSPTDAALESEADRVAERVLGGGNAGATRESPMQIQRRANAASAAPQTAPNSVGKTLSEPGRALQPALRRDMEHRFGHDFSHVRVHTGASAEKSTRDVDAQAYTVGPHVVFANGRLQPEQAEGRRLLAHELTHVVQQGRAKPTGLLRYSPQGDHHSPAEKEAEHNAVRIGQRGRLNVSVRSTGAPMLNRAPNSPGGCGVCMLPMHAGTLVHAEVASMFRAQGGLAEKRIFAPGGGKGRRGRLDLAAINERTRTIYLGEVKPNNASGAATGRRDQAFYRWLIALDPRYSTYFARDMTPAQFTPSPGYILNPRTGLSCGQVVTITPAAHGVYLYSCTPDATTIEARPDCDCKKLKKKKKKKNQKKKQSKSKSKKAAKKAAKKAPKKAPKKTPKKPKKPKGAKPKPKAKKPSQPKPKTGGGAYNVGFGLSLFSTGGGVGNAGVGVSIMSNSTGFGTAGAGVSIMSDTLAAGAAGAGGSLNSDGAAAGSVGAGTSKDSMGASAGTAGAGKSEGTNAAAAGAAGKGETKDSDLAAAGAAGSGTVKDSQVTGSGGTGSGKMENVQGSGSGSASKPVDAKDVQGGKGAGDKSQPTPEGQTGKGDGKPAGSATAGKTGTGTGTGTGDKTGTGTGDKAGTGTGDKSGTSGDKSGTGTGKGTGDKPPGATGDKAGSGDGKDTAQDAGKPGTGSADAAKQGQGTGAGSGDLKSEIATLLGGLDPKSKPEDRALAAAEAVKINDMLKSASSAQKALLAQLAQHSGNQYQVPAADWVNKLLQATKGITEDDLQYLATLDWTPSSLSAEELRKKILKVLENKNKPKSESKDGGKSGGKDETAGEGGKGKGQGAGSGQGKGAGAANKKDEGSAPPGEGSKSGPDSGKYTVARPYKGEFKGVYERDYQFVLDKSITANSQVGNKPTMTLQWIGDDKKAYYYKLKYEITEGPTTTPDKKNPKLVWLYFTLKSTNTEFIDVAPEGQAPFLIRPGREAWYRVQKP